jgi:DNA helicase-2/ATP-dependent DNA helicase PcrA
MEQKDEIKSLIGLNEVQKKAALNISGPSIIVAGPGSGKTKTLTHRIAYLIESGVRPEKILGLTFTNKAAQEMKRRVLSLLRTSDIRYPTSGVFLGTFHKLAVLILRQEAPRLGFSRGFSIYDESESLSLMKEVVGSLNFKNDSPQDVLRKISFLKNRGDFMFVGNETNNFSVPEKIRIYFDEYQKLLKQRSAFDFDDLILKIVELFRKNPEVLAKYQTRWSHVLVDEYQDTNKPQYVLIRLLCEKHRNLCVIGDDWQSIYRFRAADFKNVLRFEKDWPEAKIFFLEENYRSTKNIVSASQAVIMKNVFRTDKNLFTQNPRGDLVGVTQFLDGVEEANWIKEKILEALRQGEKLSDFAVLFRTNVQSRVFEEMFLEAGIQYQLIGGFKFYRRREIQDIQSYLQLILNPDDFLALKRAVGVPRRGIGEKTLEILRLGGNLKNKKLDDFLTLIENARSLSKKLKPSEFLQWLCKEIKYRDYLELEGDVGKERWENIMELIGVAGTFDLEAPPFGLERLVENIKLLQDTDDYEKNSNKLTLMTLHSAKGLEFPTVFIVGLEDGILPHERSLKNQEDLEEERRLLYVGMTRAKEKLFLSFAKTRFIKGEFQNAPPSRFIDDLPGENINFIDQAPDFGHGRTIYLD